MRRRALLAACQVPTAPAPVVAPCPLNTAPGRLNTWVRVYAEGGRRISEQQCVGPAIAKRGAGLKLNSKAQRGLKAKLES